ncbi:hypothetical protein [Asticcacaulis sp. AC460]|uniref:hypothetical protein n=1 Tax=Asticcacaulis sp. AC460 TaxID=1282360 RepID=UPI0012DDAD62|nr:hypothetical protein [Asticcacaulis sp. AC460]
MSISHPSRRNLMLSAGALGLIATLGSQEALAFGKKDKTAEAPNSDIFFPNANAAALSGIKRVVIANYVIAFQTEASDFREATRFNKAETAASNAWENFDVGLMQEITDAGYARLKADFISHGIEVLDTSVLASQPAYRTIQTATGFGSPAYWGNGDGKAVLVAATGLAPFQSYGPETGNFELYNGKSDGGAPNPPTMMKRLKPYQLPGWEIDLAKALDAVVVKAWQVVDFGKVEAGANRWGFGGGGGTLDRAEHTANASSHVRIREEQSRLSFRLPGSTNRKGESVRQIPATHMAPPKDGDVVVAVGNPIFLGSDLFTLSDSGETSGQRLTGFLLGGAKHINIAAHLTDPGLYKSRVSGAVNSLMDSFVNAALGTP